MLNEFIKLVRIEHALMLAIAVLIAESVTLGALPQLNAAILLSLLVPAFNQIASFALNDYVDIESDRINKKFERPLVRGTIKPRTALILSGVFYALSIGAAFFINAPAFLIAVVYAVLAVAYNIKLKDIALLGNLFIASAMAIPFIFGNIVVSPALKDATLTLALIAFLSGFAREVVKTMQDIEGDKIARKSKTLPMLIGMRNSAFLASAFYFFFIPFSFLPFSQGIKLTLLSGGLVLLADAGILYIAVRLLYEQTPEFLKQCRELSLLSLFIGLLGLLIGAIL